MNKHLYVLMNKAGEAEGGGGDRGDDFQSTEQTPEEKAAAEAAAKAEKEEADAAEAERLAKLGKKEEDEDEDEDDDKDAAKDKTKAIPLDRHKAVLERERAARAELEAKLAQYQNGQQVAEVNAELNEAEAKLLSLEAEYDKLLMDGKLPEAAKTRAEIRKLDVAINDKKREMAAQVAESRAYERARYDITVDRIEEAYPTMNPKSDEYDEALAKRVVRISHSYQLDGLPPAQALQEAVKTLLGEPASKKQEAAVEAKAKVDEAALAAAKRKEAATAKALEAAKKTPASMAKTGANSDQLGAKGLSGIDVVKMSQEEFAALAEKSPEELARLRGDLVE